MSAAEQAAPAIPGTTPSKSPGMTVLAELGPYAVLLAGSVWFWTMADGLKGSPVGAGLGPGTWPKLVIGALGAVCGYELLRRLFALVPGRHPVPPAGDDLTGIEAAEVEEAGPAAPVWGAITASIVYLLLFEQVGFALDTFAFVLVLMWLGRFRRWPLMLPISAGLTLGLLYVFMKLVFVPLPLGAGPFSAFSQALLRILGIH